MNTERDIPGVTSEPFASPPIHPVDALRDIAQQMADRAGLEVDHEAFDRAKAEIDRPLVRIVYTSHGGDRHIGLAHQPDRARAESLANLLNAKARKGTFSVEDEDEVKQ